MDMRIRAKTKSRAAAPLARGVGRLFRLLLACLCVGVLVACQDNVGAPAVDPPRPSSIAEQPASARPTEGDAAEFAVRAEGDAPLSYQWARDGSDLAGETAAVLRLPAAALLDHGISFKVRVSNGAGRR
jgi:hypothetical protein